MFSLYNHPKVGLAAIIFALVLVVLSVFYTRYLAHKFAEEEARSVATWAEATKQFVWADENTDVDFLTFIIQGNTNIPVYLMDTTGKVLMTRNVKHPKDNPAALYGPIEVRVPGGNIQYIYYDDSIYIRQLRYMPFIELGLIIIFILIAFFTIRIAQLREQDRVWIGLTKETAHQLGTPISSLMAWQELLVSSYPNDQFLPQMNMDIERLQVITERFSKVGSIPTLENVSVAPLVQSTLEYLRPRLSDKVRMELQVQEGNEDIRCMLCPSLFAWVVENLVKNAVDAMSGMGSITLHLSSEDDKMCLDISDTGRGIDRSLFYRVFKPGYTQKQRGWGLGLSLSKRIVEDYHRGKIFVKSSEPGVGTTFRIILKKSVDSGPTA